MRGIAEGGSCSVLFSLVEEGHGSYVRVSHDSLGARMAGGLPSLGRFSTTLHRRIYTSLEDSLSFLAKSRSTLPPTRELFPGEA